MPYTAPLKSSPFAQHIENLEPESQSCPTSPTLVDPLAGRPRLSRSYSSTAYVRRHRRSPSTSKSFTFPAPENVRKSKQTIDSHATIRQSPPPRSDALIPPGAMISPPESAPNSSDEESNDVHREGLRLQELEVAVRSIEQRRVSSPERETQERKPSSSVAQLTNHTKKPHPPLSKEARKISHSRSITEHTIALKQEEAVTSSPDESDGDNDLRTKRPMVRKKSGELVRPALRPPSARRRPSSMPGTPTYAKAVHFDAQLEHIRHFLQLDKPQAVSAGASPVDDYESEGGFPFNKDQSDMSSYEWDIRLPNFPRDVSTRVHQRVRLERLFLSSDKNTLVGVVAVANLAFHKHVAARFTFDHWKTISEVIAEYSDDVRRKQINDGYDRFCFSIKLDEQANLEKKTMFLCVRYYVNGQEFWDNNRAMNYQITFLRIPTSKSDTHSLPVKPIAVSRAPLPRSKTFAGSSANNQGKAPSFDDFSSMNDYLSFDRKTRGANDRPPYGVKSHDDDAVAPVRRDKQSSQIFGSRYDFEASLNAAMRTKSAHDRTTLTARAKSEVSPPGGGKYSPVKGRGTIVDRPLGDSFSQSRTQPQAEPSKPSSLLSSKPHRESSVYKELVDRYCFFGSSSPSHNTRPIPSLDKSSPHSTQTSSSQSSPTSSPKMDTATGSNSRNSSPTPHSYPYIESMQSSFLKETHRPAVIHG
ncbi:putative phosphatase regulatory subunit-domain-containing protein [Aspergillus caelatus]|uniref:Phosphatase regulatory subunit-domain-containing protein n=2 Tax=Aspergillus subgen. Circumdati TaxID=2720871 RepID=A0ABQ6WP75_9EURO|nr:putative phosphatase regulatory subunit-domain-containing protein [Aspergillus caelatus]KAE8362516.1 putative phosphatase regulatory subunit-domain-containing protein [Aspergillus caelatus]KAE8418904.1 putative phosphatase regulatory subunit-domain-containing protein [Aspergillus pseudocaelatus]